MYPLLKLLPFLTNQLSQDRVIAGVAIDTESEHFVPGELPPFISKALAEVSGDPAITDCEFGPRVTTLEGATVGQRTYGLFLIALMPEEVRRLFDAVDSLKGNGLFGDDVVLFAIGEMDDN